MPQQLQSLDVSGEKILAQWETFVRCIDTLAPSKKVADIWFRKLRPLSFDGHTLTALAPPTAFVDYLLNTHGDLIRQALDATFGKGAELSILKRESVPEEMPGELEAEQLHLPDPTLSQEPVKANLNPRYRFDNYIEGESNRFAVASARSVADTPTTTPFNPYFVYGGAGYGKTHLIQAIGNQVLRTGFLRRVVYVTSEQFVNQFIASIRTKRTTDFAHIYRNVDMLILDDIQFFTGKERTLTEFFHTFNSLYQAGKQIILSSDRPPRDLEDLDERLTSRFASGLVTELTLPDYETRVAILEKRADEHRATLEPKVVAFLASHIVTNVRDLEGALLQLIAQAQFLRKPIDLEMAHSVARKFTPSRRGPISMETIAEACARYNNIPLVDLKDRGRKKEVAHTRQVAMYICNKLTRHSLRGIAIHFGRRDHSTVIHAVKTVEDRIGADKVFASEMEDLIRSIELHA
ncbi:MAG: chromosomal replication initiator protein DnaA [bacterium]|jgi:chromosomal replication initiator protein|nr:chromosomal replication initiator protein DnaA [bacterium]